MEWRLIELDTLNAATNMAIDQAIYEYIALGRQIPTIRFYKWLPSAVSIGAYQNHNDVDLDACRKFGIDFVRRMTGGRAVFHDKSDLTYSVIAHIRSFNYSVGNAYTQICSWIVNALLDMGINAEIRNKNDIIVDGKKISGNASKAMEEGVYLQHGTIVHDLDYNIMPRVLKVGPELMKRKATCIKEHTSISQDILYKNLKKSFVDGKNITAIGLSEDELKRAETLAIARYKNLRLPKGSFSKSSGACYAVHGGGGFN